MGQYTKISLDEDERLEAISSNGNGEVDAKKDLPVEGSIGQRNSKTVEGSVLDGLVKVIPESLLPHLKTLEPFSIMVLKWIEDRELPADTWKETIRRMLPQVPSKEARERLETWYERFRTETASGRLLEEYRDSESFVEFARNNLARLLAENNPSAMVPSKNGMSDSEGRDHPVSRKENLHRIKNHLQQVISMIELKRRNSGSSAEDVLNQSIELLRSFVQLNENLETIGNPDGTTLDMETHLRTNLESLSSSFSPETLDFQLRTDMESLDISRDKIVPLGLIVNELCMNSLQHGYGSENRATLSISLSSESGEAELRVQDDGIGLPDDFDWTETYGLNLVKRLAENQLDGSLEATDEKKGAGWIIRFPLADERTSRAVESGKLQKA